MVNQSPKNFASHPVIIKARELSTALVDSEAYKANMVDEVQRMILECNRTIAATIRMDYGSIARASTGCC